MRLSARILPILHLTPLNKCYCGKLHCVPRMQNVAVPLVDIVIPMCQHVRRFQKPHLLGLLERAAATLMRGYRKLLIRLHVDIF